MRRINYYTEIHEEGTEIYRGFYWGREILEVIYTEIHGVGTEIHRGFYGGVWNVIIERVFHRDSRRKTQRYTEV